MLQNIPPGVYVEEVPSVSQPISGVGTTTAGFIGLVTDDVKRPNKPGTDDEQYPLPNEGMTKLVTNWTEFKNNFGDIQDGNKVLAHAVYGFFNNGGTRCYVARVTVLNSEKVKQALTGLKNIDEISIVAVPLPAAIKSTGSEEEPTDDEKKNRTSIHNELLKHCQEDMKDRFAILDGEDVTEDLESTKIYSGNKSDYGAVYFPYIDVSGKGEEYMPPSGHIAGIYARVDSERGVYKAPANEVIRGARGIKSLVNKSQLENLNARGINVIRQINGDITVWGARTTKNEGEYRYINVRRTMIFLRESLDKNTQWAVFEPNNPALWQKIKRNVSDFLTIQWRAGALFGNTKEEGFYVKCDAETNPPEERALGRVIAEVGVSIVRPAEFVIFRISQTTLPS